MKRAIIIARGEVQGVNYRKTVERIARKLNIVGFVENIKPYDVRIVAEGKLAVLNEFIREIQVKIPPIIVEAVDAEYEKATGEFEYFEIKRGDIVDELGERLDIAGSVMYEIRDLQKEALQKQDQMLGKQDQMLGKQDQMLGKQDQTIEKIDTLTVGVTGRLDTLDMKYGRIGDNMEKIIEELKEERKGSRESMEKILNAILLLAKKST